MHLSPQWLRQAVRLLLLLLLIHCLSLLPLFVDVLCFGLYFVMQYLVAFLALQPS